MPFAQKTEMSREVFVGLCRLFNPLAEVELYRGEDHFFLRYPQAEGVWSARTRKGYVDFAPGKDEIVPNESFEYEDHSIALTDEEGLGSCRARLSLFGYDKKEVLDFLKTVVRPQMTLTIRKRWAHAKLEHVGAIEWQEIDVSSKPPRFLIFTEPPNEATQRFFKIFPATTEYQLFQKLL